MQSDYKNLLNKDFLDKMQNIVNKETDGCVIIGEKVGHFFETVEMLKSLLSNFLIAYHYGWNNFTTFDIKSVASGNTIAQYKENDNGEFTWQGVYNE